MCQDCLTAALPIVSPSISCTSGPPAEERHRAKKTTEERAAQLQSYIPFCARCSHQACATVLAKLVQLEHLLTLGADIYIYS